MSQSSCFKSRLDLWTLGGAGAGNQKSRKLDPLSLGELDVGVQCFGDFGASESTRTMKIGRRVRELYKLT